MPRDDRIAMVRGLRCWLLGDDETVKQVFISINGDDSKSGLTRAQAIKSWKRLMQLSEGNAEWVFMEGALTEDSLMKEKIDEAAARVAARKTR